jgi:hypothetical protein
VSILAIKSADDCRYDLVALGEVMLRVPDSTTSRALIGRTPPDLTRS